MRIFMVHRRIRIHFDIFSFQVTTIPAFVNNIHPSANIHRIVWISLIVSCVIYLAIGLAGAGAFNTPPNSTILAVISARRPSIIALISIYAFPVGWFRSFCLVVVSWIDSVVVTPLAVLITSIPVFMIVIRYNLLRGNICSTRWAIFWSSIVPWIIVIPFQTNVCDGSFSRTPFLPISADASRIGLAHYYNELDFPSLLVRGQSRHPIRPLSPVQAVSRLGCSCSRYVSL